MIEVQERWGGAVEQWALSEHLKVPIIIWELCKYDKDTNKITMGVMRNYIPTKNSFFRVQQVFGETYKNPPLNLLYRNTKRCSHYMTLYYNEDI